MAIEDIKKKYKLSEEEHMKIYKTIEEEVFGNANTDNEPVAIIVGAQSGAGKASVISYSKREIEEQGKCIIVITTDEYKPYHPNAIEIARKYPTEYVQIVEQDAGEWTGKVLKKAIDDKYNFIFEGTLKSDRILDRIKELRQNGFKVTVRALAVPKLESMIAIHERYQNQIEHMGWGRLIEINHHNQAYDGVPETIDKIEKSGLCDVEIYIRGNEIGKPVKVYDKNNKNEAFLNARMALEEYRKIEISKTMKTAKQRIQTLRRQFEERNADDKEMKQLDELEYYIEQEER